MSFATRILQRSRLPCRKIHVRQLKGSLRSIQQRIKSPRTGDLIALKLSDEDVEFCGAVVPGLAGTWPNVRSKCSWIAGVTHTDRKGRLRQGQSRQQKKTYEQRSYYPSLSHRDLLFSPLDPNRFRPTSPPS